MESAQPSGVRTELHDGFSDHLEPTAALWIWHRYTASPNSSRP